MGGVYASVSDIRASSSFTLKLHPERLFSSGRLSPFEVNVDEVTLSCGTINVKFDKASDILQGLINAVTTGISRANVCSMVNDKLTEHAQEALTGAAMAQVF